MGAEKLPNGDVSQILEYLNRKKDFKTEYRKISVQYLLQGMYASSDVYYVFDEKPVLLCSHSVFSKDMLQRLRRVASKGARIFVSYSDYDALMDQYAFFSKRNIYKVQKYQEIKTEVKDLLKHSGRTGRVDEEQTAAVVQKMEKKLGKIDISFVLQWTGYMREMDEYLNAHSTNVGILNGMMADWLELGPAEKKRLITIGLLHDVGKMMIPSSIIDKPGKLTKEEFETVKLHSVYSYDMIKKSGMKDEVILKGIRGHHERMNGTGYPDGLTATEIPLYARITAIADVYDAMVSKRCYKDAQSPFVVLNEFYRSKFSDLDITLVDNFLDKMCGELIGKDVIMNDGRLARIAYVEKSDFAHPYVDLGVKGKIYETGKNFFCATLCNEV